MSGGGKAAFETYRGFNQARCPGKYNQAKYGATGQKVRDQIKL